MPAGNGPHATLLERLENYRPEKAMLKGAAIIQPLSQGDCDGLCGLYAIINGIRLILAPTRPLEQAEVSTLFKTGIRFLDEHANLSRAVSHSVSPRAWPKLAEKLRARAQRMTGIPLEFRQPLVRAQLETSDEILAPIERIIFSQAAALTFMRGKYRHYSVICGYSRYSLKLFDSYGYYWVRRSSCAASRHALSLHRFHIESLIAAAIA